MPGRSGKGRSSLSTQPLLVHFFHFVAIPMILRPSSEFAMSGGDTHISEVEPYGEGLCHAHSKAIFPSMFASSYGGRFPLSFDIAYHEYIRLKQEQMGWCDSTGST